MNRVSPEEKFAQDMALKLAGKTPKTTSKLTTIKRDGVPWIAFVSPDDPTNIKWVGPAKDPGKGVNIDMTPEPSFAKGIGTLGSEIMGDAREQAIAARAMRDNLQYIIDSPSTSGGPLAEVGLFMKQLGKSMGLPIETAEEEVLQALGNQLAVAARGGAFSGGKPLTGSTSEKDLRMLLASIPGLKKTVEGRKLLATLLSKKNQRVIDRWDSMRNAYVSEGNSFNPVTWNFEEQGDEGNFHDLVTRAATLAQLGEGGANPTPEKQSYVDSLLNTTPRTESGNKAKSLIQKYGMPEK
jgi:hypothetical protein